MAHMQDTSAGLQEQTDNVFYKLTANTSGSTQLTAEAICCLCGHFEKAASTVASSVWQQYYQMHNWLCQLASMRAVSMVDWHSHVSKQVIQLPVIDA